MDRDSVVYQLQRRTRLARRAGDEGYCVIFSFFALAASLAGTSVSNASIYSIAEDVRAVVVDVAPLPLSLDIDEARTLTGRLLIVWAWRESAWKVGAIGDNGASLGVLQLNKSWLGGRDAEVLTDRRLALRMGLSLMRDLVGTCGTVKRALHAYASGTCHGNHTARELVLSRCKLSGAC